MRAELSDDPADFLARDWTALVDADPAGTFFHTPAYLKLWWEEFGRGSLLIARTADRDGEAAACAFEVVADELRFLGGFDVTDYMGPVGRPDALLPAAGAILDAAFEASWERADLRGLPASSPWLRALASAGRRRGLRVTEGEDGVAPCIALPASREEYLARLPAKLRHELRRKARRLAAEAGPYELRLSTAASVQRDLDRFFELHRASPGPKGRFMEAGMEIFFRRLAEAFLAPHVFHVAFLEIDGQAAAGAVGFGYGDTFSLYNSAFDRDFAHLSPGIVLVADLVGESIDSGRRVFDLLKGDLDYKYRFGSSPRPVRRLVMER